LAIVISWPPIDEKEDEHDYQKRLKAFEISMLSWLKDEFGDDLALVLRHDDEPFKGLNAGKIHYHWHAFAVKEPGEKFNLHPGFLARSKMDVSRKNRKNLSHDEFMEMFNEGKEAYKRAMIAFQDRFYEKLGKLYGLERKGPCRLRRSRNEQVELEEFVEKELAYPKRLMSDAINLKIESESIKNQAENIKLNAKNEAGEIIKESESNAENIKKNARIESEKIIKNAESLAMDTKEKAWRDAKEITDNAKINATSIIEKAKGLINRLLKEIDELPGGQRIVKWAKTFIKENTKPTIESDITAVNNKLNKVKGVKL